MIQTVFSRKTPLLLSLTALLLAGNAALADEHKGPPDRQHPHWERMAEHLSLTEEQQAAWKALMAQGQEQGASDRQRSRDIQQQLRELRGNYDAGRAQALANELGEIKARQALRHAEHQAAVYQMLEPEQRERWDAARQHRGSDRGKGHKHDKGGKQRTDSK